MVISFHVTPQAGQPVYLQIVEQVRQAMRMGQLVPGDRLPTVREVAAAAAVNPNTVLKAYRELEHEQLVKGRPGQGTFVVGSLSGPSPQLMADLHRGLRAWVDRASNAGLEPEHIRAMVDGTLRARFVQEATA